MANNIKKTLSTHDEFLKSMTPAQKKEYDKGYNEFLLSEILIAIKKNDAAAVMELAKIVGISPELRHLLFEAKKK